MSKLLVFTAPHMVGYQDTEDTPLNPDDVRIKTLYSGISAGTELTFYRGTNPYLSKRWDADNRLFRPGEPATFSYPVTNLGYEEVGEVVEVGAGVADIPVGARVFGTWGHRTHFAANPDYVRPRLMPDGADPLFGIFSHLGAIALNGVHDADIKLGDTVAVFGLGALGQIVAIMARKSGATVIAVDLHDSRLELARSLGADVTLNATRDKPAETLKEMTRGLGADVCIEVSGSTAALHEAIRAVAYSAKVVAMGFFQGDAHGLYLGDEFHHNRIQLVCSQISGVSPETSYRWNKLRLWQSAVRMQTDGWFDLRPLITHRAPFERAAALYEALDQRPDEVLLAVLEFDGAKQEKDA
ncbi:MAG: zinc-binding alcohol dehydrogenase [Chloroflexi bacterium]|nr:zinc-binding alcohol dehydrogenase [Chloroflexota bacterium]